jgi:Spy/CpxP family protein refolding chaperone
MNNKYRLWIALSLLVAFAAGVLGGVFAERIFLHPRKHTRVQRAPSRPPDLEEMARNLGLSPEQKESIRQIFERNDGKFKELYTDMHRRLADIRSEIKNEIDAVLTPEQKEKMEAIIARHGERRKKQKESEQKDKNSARESSPDKPEGERQ